MKIVLSAVLLFASIGIASNLQEVDLSGAWRLTSNLQGHPVQFDIILIKTNLNVGGDPFYQVLGSMFGDEFKGLRVRKIGDNKFWLSWYLFKDLNHNGITGTRLDGEGNIVLNVLDNNNSLVLGPDVTDDNEEVARLTRLTWFDAPTLEVPSAD